MRSRIAPIGNSRGIRLPESILEQAGLADEVEILAEPGRIIIEAAPRPRRGWADAARAMAEAGDDALMDEPTPTSFDTEEWT
jgi:antitoxin MazE